MKKVNIFKLLFILTIAAHYITVVCFVLTAVLSWQYMPFYQYVTLLGLVIRVGYSRDHCPLTKLENCIGQKLGYTKSNGFIVDWIIKPLRKLIYD